MVVIPPTIVGMKSLVKSNHRGKLWRSPMTVTVTHLCEQCEVCQQRKEYHDVALAGLLQPLPFPSRVE